ncbi:MAG: lysostaphin resistance A-like protein [Hyphomicrobiaceae bacterium]
MTEQPMSGSVPSVPLPSPGDAAPWTVWRALLASVLIFGGGQLLALALLQGAICWMQGWDAMLDAGASEKLGHKTQQWLVVGIQLVVTLVELALAWRIAGWGGRNRFAAINLLPVRFSGGDWVKAIALVLGVKLAVSVVVVPLSGGRGGSVAQDMAPFLEIARDARLWLCFLAAAILAGLIEEIVFRGILSRTLESTALGFWGGATLASAIFAVMHLQYGLVGQIVVFAMGLTFSWLRASTGSIWPGVVTHALNNALALLIMKIMVTV